MKEKLLLLSLVLFIDFTALSQSVDWDNYNKYWYYRYQLVNDFLIRGEEDPLVCNQTAAYSIPAEVAFAFDKDLHWGDATLYLGWYIAVLATEYQLLKNNNQPTDSTKRELYFAMKAYERLDRKAERLFYPQNPNADCSDNYLNGLFVRDDINETAFQNYPKFRAKYESDDQNFIVGSDYIRSGNGVNDYNSYPSQDQIAHLFIGFALVKKCLGNATYQGYNFTEQAVNYTNKIARRLETNDWQGRLENGELYAKGHIFREEHTAYGVAKAAEWITGINYTSKFGVTGGELATQISGWQKYGDPTLGPAIMDVIYYIGKVDFTTALLQSYAAIGSSWEFGLIPVRKEYTIDMPGVCVRYISKIPLFYPCAKSKITITCYEYELSSPGFLLNIPLLGCYPYLPPVTIPVTNEALSLYGSRFNQQIYPLIHEFLHNIPNNISNSVYASLIHEAPCEGPHYKPQNNPLAEGINGWRVSNRWVRPLAADGYNDLDKNYTQGKFNGLDYMLVYNLYLLTRGQGGIIYKNRLNSSSMNAIATAGDYWSYESLELSGVIQSNSSTNANPVEISANNSIRLKPGFKTKLGAIVKIYLGNHTACNTTIGNSESLKTAPSSIAEKNNETIQKEILEDIKIKIQSKLDTIAATYSGSSSYIPLNEYLAKNNKGLVKNNNEEELENEQITIYPNPTNNDFTLEFYLKSNQQTQIIMKDIYDNNSISLFDGFLKSGTNQLTFNSKDFKKGVLIIEIKGKEFHTIKRLIKQ